MNANKTYIIIVNYKNWEDTITCVKSVESNGHNYKIVLIDVDNKNNSIIELNKGIPLITSTIHFIKLAVNKGYAYANNIGIKYALEQNDCDYIWLLNNDTVINKTTLSSLISFHKSHKNVGFVGAKILDYYHRDTIQTVGGWFKYKIGYSIMIGLDEKDHGQYDKTLLEVDYVIGASMFFNKELVSEIGLMPEEYFLYYEDIDWCLTAKNKGYTNFVDTKSIVYHKQGKSTGNNYVKQIINTDTLKYLYTNYLIIYRKHFPKYIYIAYIMLLKQGLGSFLKGHFKKAAIIGKSIFH